MDLGTLCETVAGKKKAVCLQMITFCFIYILHRNFFWDSVCKVIKYDIINVVSYTCAFPSMTC